MAVKEIQKLDRSQYERDLNPEKLELNKKNLHVFPSLAGEDRLRMLSLQNNYISEIKSVSHLSNLACLDLYNNQIESMEPLRELTSLRVLMLGRNRIKTIQGLTILTQLDILDLHHNQIQDLTTGLSTLKSLRILNLENNHITEIPTLTGLQRLAELNVKRNVISSMDKNSHLISLQRLLMDENKFKGLQEIVNVFELSGLAELSLGQNPVADLSMFRLAIIGKMSGLKILNGKRVLEDERRQAYRWIKKGVEKQQLQDKKLVQQEEKYSQSFKETLSARH
ncbi:hypothetical protein EDD86DRAFT_9146 [Gorgonomyces haynaldii]|nr:hypothetical protein EDD86DRAFT_9146 [Gorgonomyces haynaldii]